MTREDPDASTSDDSDIEIQLPIAVKRNHADMPESTETTQKRIAAVEKKKSEEEQEQREEVMRRKRLFIRPFEIVYPRRVDTSPIYREWSGWK